MRLRIFFYTILICLLNDPTWASEQTSPGVKICHVSFGIVGTGDKLGICDLSMGISIEFYRAHLELDSDHGNREIVAADGAMSTFYFKSLYRGPHFGIKNLSISGSSDNILGIELGYKFQVFSNYNAVVGLGVGLDSWSRRPGVFKPSGLFDIGFFFLQ